MKSLIVLCLFVAAVSAVPARRNDYDDDDDSFFLFPQRQRPVKDMPSVVEVEVGDSDEDSSGGFFPSYVRPFFVNPFNFMNFGFSDFFTPSWIEKLIPKNNSDDVVKNSTSSTKIVDGHKITINQTIYENEKNGAVHRVQVIEVSPIETDEKEVKNQQPESEQTEVTKELDTRVGSAEDAKPDQNSRDNEIHREEKLASYELQGDDPYVYNNVETFNVGNIDKRQNVDLSSDIRVNALLAENHRRGGLFMVPPEVEVFDSLDYDYQAGKLQQQQILDPQFNQQIVKPQFNPQQIVQPQYNPQQTIQPQYNPQQIVQPQYNPQQIVQPQYNPQQIVQPQYNPQQIVQPQYNPQQIVQPQYNPQQI